MKGVILQAIRNLITEKLGKDKWKEISRNLNIPSIVSPGSDIEDEKILKLIDTIAQELSTSKEKVIDMFSNYWISNFAPRIYSIHYQRCKDAKSFILALDNIHKYATSHLPGASPPRFTYEEKDPNTIIMTYHSTRRLTYLWKSLIKAIGDYFKEPLKIKEISDNKIEISFR